MSEIELNYKISSMLQAHIVDSIKLSKTLLIIEGLLVAMNEAVTVIAKHEHGDEALKSIEHYLEEAIDSTNDKVSEL